MREPRSIWGLSQIFSRSASTARIAAGMDTQAAVVAAAIVLQSSGRCRCRQAADWLNAKFAEAHPMTANIRAATTKRFMARLLKFKYVQSRMASRDASQPRRCCRQITRDLGKCSSAFGGRAPKSACSDYTGSMRVAPVAAGQRPAGANEMGNAEWGMRG